MPCGLARKLAVRSVILASNDRHLERRVRERVVIGIHGLNRKPQRQVLAGWWSTSISEGIQRNTIGYRNQVDFELVYWADLLYGEPIAALADEEAYVAAKGQGPLPSGGPSLLAITAAVLEGGLGQALRMFFKGSVVDDIVARALEERTPDLGLYQGDPEKRNAVRQRLFDRLSIAHATGKEIMLIAHSMGSVIAYDVLADAERILPKLRVAHLLTLGSPLGVEAVKHILATPTRPLRVPDCVARWSNLADPADHYARWDARLVDDYADNAQGVSVADHLVINGYVDRLGKADHHKVYGYLRTPEVSAAVTAFVPCVVQPNRMKV